MDVSNLLGHLLINPATVCLRPGLQVPQVYLSSLVSLPGDNGLSVGVLVQQQQQPQKEEESKSEGEEEDSDECEEEYESNDADDASEEGLERGTDGGRKARGKNRAKCIHRTRYSREEYRCESCPYSCTTEKAFLRHVRQCSGKDGADPQNSPLSCPVCGKDRKNETSLSVHMVKHKSGKHFCCDLCKFKSIQLKKIIQHRRMHTGEKPHLCPHCSYRSSRRDNLRSHVRRMHNEDDLHCDTFTPRKILIIPKQSQHTTS